MTNELVTTLDDIQAKAERKREALTALNVLGTNHIPFTDTNANPYIETIRKYIEEN